ncbi:MAG: FkbM family methyltransferase [Verrucomicrobiales bacterium]|jgi:FkbM family methyltransferase|nr:FkbM family methyltransferase [Verrucomicrobiales bacterium]
MTFEIIQKLPIDGIIDGGANVGEFASLMRTSLPDADLVCVEPNPFCAQTLRRAGYKVVEAALWSEETALELSQPANDDTSCTVLHVFNKIRPSFKVLAKRLDQIPIQGSNLFIKLDLQGAEPQALEGMGNMWSRCVLIQMEVSIGINGNYELLRELLQKNDFYEYATVNHLITNGIVQESDKIWIKKDFLFKYDQYRES